MAKAKPIQFTKRELDLISRYMAHQIINEHVQRTAARATIADWISSKIRAAIEPAVSRPGDGNT